MIDDIARSYLIKPEDIIRAMYAVPVRDMIAETAKLFRDNKPA